MKLFEDGEEVVLDDGLIETCDPTGRPTLIKKRINRPENGWNLQKGELQLNLMGQDVEYWGGNFGTRFSGEKLFLQLVKDSS